MSQETTTPNFPFPETGLKIFNFDVVKVNVQGQEVRREKAQAQYYAQDLGNGITLDMIAIPGGKFLMGAAENEEGASDDEYPQHEVTVQPFYMSKYPITQAQWRAIASRTDLIERDLKPDPSYFKGDNKPVERVSWDDALEFCARLSKLTGREYRLPSEAEWEYACRAGTTTPFYFGETITTDLVNYYGNRTYADAPKGQYRETTTPVGQFPPNSFGLYDMHGQVWEWCTDTWHENYQDAPRDGSGWRESDHDCQVLRGGSWYNNPDDCRSAKRYRNWRDDFNRIRSFRVVCVSGGTF